MKFRSIIHQILEDTKVLNYYKDKEPIKDTDKIRVYHGFYSPADALVTLSYGLSGEMRAARIYSYESGNNPKGLFVSTDFNVVKKNFAGSGIIIEFDTRATNLEAPVWAGQDTYFVQGQYTKSFKDDEERNQETIRKREKYRQEDPEGDYHNNRISKSDRPELGDSLYGNYEKQALFIGNLNPNEIKSVWFNEGRYFRNKTNEPWTRYDRKSFLRKYGDILEKDSKGNEKIHRVSNKFFKPNDDFSMEKLKAITDAKGYDWKDVLDYLKRDDYIRSQLLWPKQMIKNGDVIFYLIKHGDWNIKDPISRFASGVYGENTEAFWGSPTDKFKNFVRTWLPKFRTDALGDKKIDYKNDDTEKLKSLSGYMENETVVIGIIENNRFDVIKRFIEVGYNNEKILKTILKLFGPKYYKNMLSKEMKDILDPVINEILDDINRKVSHLYTFIFEFEGSKIDRHLNDLLSKDIDGTVLNVLIDYYKGEGFVKWNEVYFDEDIRLICPIKPDSCNEFKPKWMKLMQHAGNDRNKLMSLLRDRNDSILARLKQKLEPE